MRKKIAWSLAFIISICAYSNINIFAEIKKVDFKKASMISVNCDHTLAVMQDGMLYAWGDNSDGELGDGTRISKYKPIKVMPNVKFASAGNYRSAAIKKDGTLWVWGEGCYKDGRYFTKIKNDKYLYPKKIAENIKFVLVDTWFIAVIKNDNTLWVYKNYLDKSQENSPIQKMNVPKLVTDNVRNISLSNNSLYIVKYDGSVGYFSIAEETNTFNKVDGIDNVMEMSQGGNGFFFLKNDGSLMKKTYLVSYEQLEKVAENIKKIIPNSYPLIAFKNDGTLYGPESFSKECVKVLNKAKFISTNTGTTACVENDGTIMAWGNNQYGQLGNGESSQFSIPQTISTGVTQVAAGSLHTVYLKKDGTVWTLGNNENGQLGDGTTEKRSIPVKVIDKVKQITARGNNTYVVKQDNTLWAWGSNLSGQIGDNTRIDREKPIKVMENVKIVRCGWSTVAVVKSDNSLWMWGTDFVGDRRVHITMPTKILDNIKDVSIGDDFIIVIKKDNSMLSWGANSHGELGDGTQTSMEKPVEVNVVKEAENVTASDDCLFVIKNDNSLWIWGSKTGIIPYEISYKMPYDQVIKVMDDVQSISCYSGSYLVIKKDNTLWAAGNNILCKLGDINKSFGGGFVKIGDGVKEASIGYCFSLILKTDGTLQGFGYNNNGQLGNKAKDEYVPCKIVIK